MYEHVLTQRQLSAFAAQLRREERSAGTTEKYLRDVGRFARWLEGRPVTAELAAAWREHLTAQGYASVTVNSMISPLNHLFRFLGWEECRIKFLKIQRRVFRDQGRELTRPEYDRLLAAARRRGENRLALLMEAICSTGVRVSEVKYITVEAAEAGRTEVRLKGKIRTILLPGKLCRKLLKYAKTQKTVSGEIFLTRNGKSLGRRQIWAEMKRVCREAGVVPSKVFPHNLRHLFATTFYRACKDIVRLADVLGHSSIDTTRIYLMTTGEEHARLLEGLRLIS